MSDWKNVQYKDGKYRTSDEGGGGASVLTDLSDVNVSSPSDGQVLKYDSTTQKWKNENESGGGAVEDVTLDGNSVVNGQGVAVLTTPNVSNLKDTNISSPLSGQTLQYNATTQKWENTTPASGGNVDDVKVNGTSVVTNKVANIKSYKEVTQAEYEALPDTKLNDNILYAIKDGGQAVDGFPPLIYSTDEREIGVWIDGKPLYQKTLNFQPTSGAYTIDLSSLSIDKITDMSGVIVETNGNIAPISYFTASSDYSAPYFTVSGNIMHARYAGNWNSGTWLFTLQYTKYTDTPGSGTWNQQGALAHHYSTDEKIIGTWIDGKPIYEKTISPLTTTSGNYALDVSALHLNEIIDFRIFVHNSTGGDYAFGSYWQDQQDKLGWYLQSNKSNLIIRSGSGYAYGTGWCIIQYTKATD